MSKRASLLKEYEAKVKSGARRLIFIFALMKKQF